MRSFINWLTFERCAAAFAMALVFILTYTYDEPAQKEPDNLLDSAITDTVYTNVPINAVKYGHH